MRLSDVFITGLLIVTIPTSQAATVLHYGQTYPILEPDFIHFIEQQAKRQDSDRLLNQLQSVAQNRFDRPTSIHLPSARKAHEMLFDPSVTLSAPILDAEGQVLVLAGTRFNPLDHVQLSHTYIFIDADDARQVKWAEQQLAEHPDHIPILTGGSVKNASSHFNRVVYFDQQGALTRHFKIKHVPARLAQVGKQLRISEVPV